MVIDKEGIIDDTLGLIADMEDLLIALDVPIKEGYIIDQDRLDNVRKGLNKIMEGE